MIVVHMAVSAGPHELTGFQIGLLRDHHGEQRIGRDIERYAEEHIATALIQLA